MICWKLGKIIETSWPLLYSLQHRLLGTGFQSGRDPKIAVIETPQRGLYKGLTINSGTTIRLILGDSRSLHASSNDLLEAWKNH